MQQMMVMMVNGLLDEGWWRQATNPTASPFAIHVQGGVVAVASACRRLQRGAWCAMLRDVGDQRVRRRGQYARTQGSAPAVRIAPAPVPPVAKSCTPAAGVDAQDTPTAPCRRCLLWCADSRRVAGAAACSTSTRRAAASPMAGVVVMTVMVSAAGSLGPHSAPP